MYWGAFSFPPIAVASPPRGAGSLSLSSLKPRGQPGGGVRTNPRNSYLVPCGISWGDFGSPMGDRAEKTKGFQKVGGGGRLHNWKISHPSPDFELFLKYLNPAYPHGNRAAAARAPGRLTPDMRPAGSEDLVAPSNSGGHCHPSLSPATHG